jgi:hypothetical protein
MKQTQKKKKQKENEIMSLFDMCYEALMCGTTVENLEKACMASIKEAAAKVEEDRKQREREYRLAKTQ